MTVSEYVEEMSELFVQLGRQPLEGRLVALLLARPGPFRLKEVAKTLGVTKAAVSKLANEMLERGDLKREGVYSSREHAYDLVDNAFIAHMRLFRDVARQMADLSIELAGDPTVTDTAAVQRLHYVAGVNAQVALALERVLQPEEKLQEADLRQHHEENWDAVPARRSRKADA